MDILPIIEIGAGFVLVKNLLPFNKVAGVFKREPKLPESLIEIREQGDGRCYLMIRETAKHDWRYLGKDGFRWTDDYKRYGSYKNYDEAVAVLKALKEAERKQQEAETTIKVHVLETV